MLGTLLYLATTTLSAAAANIPFFAVSEPADISSLALDTPVATPWACDVRSWTRAPDLAPGVVVPAETRLAVNGTDCKDIIGWKVGLRYKERAIVKLKSKSIAEFPVKPQWTFNETSMRANEPDRNDLYMPSVYFPQQNSFDDEMKRYALAVRNHSLWEVHGAERIVYDILLDLPFSGESSDDLDLVESFSVHMPYTNFPPVEANLYGGSFSGSSEQMIRAETMSEYYHLLLLSNGSSIDIPAGRTGFLSAPQAVSISNLGIQSSIPQTAKLVSPRQGELNQNLRSMHSDRDPRYPECDRGNFSSFTIIMDPLTEESFGGAENITVHLTLIRNGNGTEIPAYLDINHHTLRNNTFAWNYLSTEEEYQAVVNPEQGTGMRMMGGRADQVLAITSVEQQKKMEEERKQRHKVRGNGTFFGRERRHHFNSTDVLDKYELKVNVSIGELDFNTFQSTFQEYRSGLAVELATTYGCLNHSSSAHQSQFGGPPRPKLTGRDAEWVEFYLPRSDSRTRENLKPYYHQPHTANLYLDLVPALSFPTPKENVRHYLDSRSTGPVLSTSTSDMVIFPPLDQSIREEREDELKRSRYNIDERQFRKTSRPWNDGSWMHAAKVWQKKENPVLPEKEVKSDMGFGGFDGDFECVDSVCFSVDF